jgi:uncharacterized membrane protein
MSSMAEKSRPFRKTLRLMAGTRQMAVLRDVWNASRQSLASPRADVAADRPLPDAAQRKHEADLLRAEALMYLGASLLGAIGVVFGVRPGGVLLSLLTLIILMVFSLLIVSRKFWQAHCYETQDTVAFTVWLRRWFSKQTD